MAEKEILVKLEIDAKTALKELAQTRIEVEKLKEEQKKVNTTTIEGKQEFERLGAEIRNLNSVARDYQKEIGNNIKSQQAQEGSLQFLKAQLSLSTAELNKMSEAERNSAKGQGLANSISAITAKLKEEEEAIGNSRRSVGDYEKATRSLRSELKESTEQIARMILEGTNSGPVFDAMVQNTSELRDAIGDASGAINAMASDTSSIDALGQAVQGVTAAFGVYSSIVGLSSDDTAKYEQVTKNLQITMAALMSVTTLMNIAQKESALYQTLTNIARKAGIVQSVRATAAEAAYTQMKTAGSLSAKTAAAAQWLLNAALASNPVIAVIIAVTALVVGVTLLTSAFDSSAKATKAAERANADYERQAKRTADAIADIDRKLSESTAQKEINAKNELAILIRSGASKEAIAKKEKELSDSILQDELSAIDERVKAQQPLVDSALKNVTAQEKLRDSYILNSKKYREAQVEVNALNAVYKEHLGTVEALNLGYNNLLATRAVDNAKIAAQDKETAKQSAKTAEDRLIKAIDLETKLGEARLKTEQKYRNDSTKSEFENALLRNAHEIELETRTAKLKDDAEKKKLEIQRKYGSISQVEYQKQLEIIALGQTELQNEQIAKTAEIYNVRKQQIIDSLKKDVEAQISELEKEFADASRDIANDQSLNESQKAYYRVQLAQQEAEQIKAIREASIEAQIKAIEEKYTKQYAGDLALFSDNEREKSLTEIAILEQVIAEKKELNIGYADDELNLRNRQLLLNKIGLDVDLLNTDLSLKQRYTLKKKALEAELALQKGNADEQAFITADLKALDAEYRDNRIANVEMWAGKSMEVLGALNGLANAIGQAEVQKAEEDNTAKQASLDKRLKSGQLSQRQYDKENLKLANDLDKKKAKIARESAIRERIMSITQATISTALAVLNALNTKPFLPLGPIMAGVAGAMGAVQIATIMATPLPKAAKGGYISGKKHTDGGVVIEAEGGESIINARATAAYPELVNLLNVIGNSGRVPDGGYSTRTLAVESLQTATNKSILNDTGTSGGIDYEMLTDMVATKLGAKIEQIKVYTSLEEFRKSEKIYTEIEQSRRI